MEFRRCTIRGTGPAILHAWGLGFLSMTGRPAQMGSVGICELPDGSVVKASPEFIKFSEPLSQYRDSSAGEADHEKKETSEVTP